MLLSAAQIDHWVVMYDVKEASSSALGDWDMESWLNDKKWLKEQFPLINLPFLVECGGESMDGKGSRPRVICQTNAILSYLGRELNMMGTTKAEQSQCEELLCEIMDLRNLMVGFAYRGVETDA